jgi:hypothetical protein
VRVTTLAKLAEEMRVDRIDAAKIDVEGGELPILSAYLKATPPELWPRLLILERADMGGRDAPDAAAFALSKGYAVRRAHDECRSDTLAARVCGRQHGGNACDVCS